MNEYENKEIFWNFLFGPTRITLGPSPFIIKIQDQKDLSMLIFLIFEIFHLF